MTVDPALAGKKILVLCPYPPNTGAGQRLKFEQFYDDWRSAGAIIDVAPFMDMRLWDVLYRRGFLARKAIGVLRGYLRRVRDLARIRSYDLVYVFMWVTPLGPALFERATRGLARRMIYDIEDNVLVERQPGVADNPNPLLRFLRGLSKPKYLVRKADSLITSSPALNKRCRELSGRDNATYISSSADTDRFLPVDRSSQEGAPVIGWTGTFSTKPFLDLLRPVFQRLAQRRRFRLRVIGNFAYDLPGVDLEVLRWSASEEVAQLQGIDIGVYPLALQNWVSGKSGLKAIQYMAFGLPCVATAVGTTPRIIRDGENGFLVRTDEEWLVALERLIDDPALRRRLGHQARADAEAHYSVRAVATDYRRVFNRTLEA